MRRRIRPHPAGSLNKRLGFVGRSVGSREVFVNTILDQSSGGLHLFRSTNSATLLSSVMTGLVMLFSELGDLYMTDAIDKIRC